MRRVHVLCLPLALLLGGTLTGCHGGEPTPTDDYTVEVNDTQYNLTFTYQTNRKFQYALEPLSGFSPSEQERQMLELVNAERARGGVCPLRGGGVQPYPPAAPLHFEGHLHKAAALYAAELAASGQMDLPHRSQKTQRVPSQRIVDAGYKPLPPNGTPMLFFESLAAEKNELSPGEVIRAWKTSPDHCAALYEAMTHSSHGAVARVEVRHGDQRLAYWALNTAGY